MAMGRVQHGYCTACQLVLPGRWENRFGVSSRLVSLLRGISDLRCSSKRATFGVVCNAPGSPSDGWVHEMKRHEEEQVQVEELADRTYLEYQHSPSQTTADFFFQEMSSFSCGQAPICKLTVGWPILTKLLTPITLSDWGGSLPLHPLCPGKFRFSSIQQLDFDPSGGKLTHGYPWMRSKESFMTVHSRAFSHTATLDFPGFFSSPFPFLGSFSLFFPFSLVVPFVFVVSHPFPFFLPFVSFFQDGQDPQPGLNHWKLSFARQISFGTFVFRCLS